MKKSTLKFSKGDRIAYVNSGMVHFTGTVSRADPKSHTPYDVQPDDFNFESGNPYHNVTSERLIRLTDNTFFVTRTNGQPDFTAFRILNREELFLVVGTAWYGSIIDSVLSTKSRFKLTVRNNSETIEVQYFKP